MEQLKEDYRDGVIGAKDVILPPFKEGLSNEQIEVMRHEYIS